MPTETKGIGETLGKKVGPLPLGAWLAIGGGVWWYFNKKNNAAGPGGTAANGTTQTGYGTDPAGNTGYIDPSTGYVYGSAEDVAALQSQGLVGANSYNTGGDGTTSGTGASGSSTDTGSTTSNPSGTATSTPDGSATGTTGGTSTGGATTSSSGSWKYPAPTGLRASSISDSGYSLSWNGVQGPNGQKPSSYTVMTTQQNGKKVDQFTAHGTGTKEYGAGGKGLHPGWTYRTDVWANGSPTPAPHASITVTVKPKGTK